MDPLLSRFNEALEGRCDISDEDVNELANRYPFFFLPATLLLVQNKKNNAPREESLLQSVAILTPDRVALGKIIGSFNDKFADFYPSSISQETDTDTTIDKFLSRYGNSSSKVISALETAIFNPQPEYASVLANENEADLQSDYPQTDEDRRIALFISEQNSEEEREVSVAFDNEVVDYDKSTCEIAPSASLSETLAASYIKQHKYRDALDILEKLNSSLQNNANQLLVDRIRFLKKLIIITDATNKQL